MRFLLALKQINSAKNGFTLLEMMIVVVILSIATAIGAPSLVGSMRQNKVNRVFTQTRAALIQAQTNANRLSSDCLVTITDTLVSASPTECLLENVTIDDSVVSVISNRDGTIEFNFQGGIAVSDMQTFQIARKDFSGNVMDETGKCIVMSNTLGMIRTGIYDDSASANCNNSQNDRYENL